MRQEPARMDGRAMSSATRFAAARYQEALRLAELFQKDPCRDIRLAQNNCIPCHYRSVIAGAAMTTRACMCCHKDQLYPSTNTDVLCLECAETHGLCKHCGGDIDMDKARRDWPTAG